MRTFNKYIVLIFTCFLFVAFNLSIVQASNDEWNQFRLNSENNPVIQDDTLKLDEQTITTTDEIRSTPVVVGNKIFIGNHDSGNIYVQDLKTGELLWENQAPNWIHSEIIYVSEQLYVGYGNRFFQDNGIRGTGDSGLLSLDTETGEVLWNFETEGEVMPTPAYYNGTVYITTGDKHLYGVDPANGEEEWSLELGSTVSMSSPNIKDGILYVGGSSEYVFYAVDLDKKEIKWKTPIKEATSGLDDVPPVVSDEGIVYTTAVKPTEKRESLRQVYNSSGFMETYKQMIKIVAGNFINKPPRTLYEHKMYAMDIQDGTVVWEKSLGEGQMVPNNKSGAPMLYEGKVFVGSPITKSFYAFDARNGEKLWDFASNINKAPPAADQDVVYFTDTKGLVYGFEAASGELLGKKLLGGKLAPSGPILVNDHLIVGSQDTNVYVTPTKKILGADDEVPADQSEKSIISYIFFVYVLPIGILALAVLGVAYLVVRVKRGRNSNSV